jgi:isopenicillin N synthase-like dioxygenase
MSSTTESVSFVPTVDVAAWDGGTSAERAELCAQIDAMGREVGFLAVTGHGVPEALRDEMLAVTAAFFDLPVAAKVPYSPADKSVNRGYAGFGEESLAYSLGVEALPDMFEAFNIGAELATIPGAGDDPYYTSELHRFFAPNVWPAELPGMRDVWLRYWAVAEGVAKRLDDICSVALGMPEDFIWSRSSKAPNVMRANNYQRRDEHAEPLAGQMRMGAHTDYGVLTVLLADPVPGLQILGIDGAWHDVIPPPGAFLVNIGDLLAEWTNDRWRSTLHRVVPPPAGIEGPFRRRSIAFFHEADYDALIEVMASCLAPGEAPRYAPVTSGDHLMAKLMGPRTLTASDAQQTSTTDVEVITG